MISEDIKQILIINGLFALLFVGWSIWILWQSRRLAKLEKKLLGEEVRETKQVLKKSEEILEDTFEKSAEFLKHNEALSTQIKSELSSAIQAVLKDNLAALKVNANESMTANEKFIGQAQKIYTGQLEKAVSSINQSVKEMIDKFADQLQGQTTESKTGMDEKFNHEYQKFLQEIADYKAQKIKQIDEDIQQKTSQLIKQILPNSLSSQDHTELILQALDQAKKDAVLV